MSWPEKVVCQVQSDPVIKIRRKERSLREGTVDRNSLDLLNEFLLITCTLIACG